MINFKTGDIFTEDVEALGQCSELCRRNGQGSQHFSSKTNFLAISKLTHRHVNKVKFAPDKCFCSK